MAVEVSRVKSRLKSLYPKANLSQKRIDEISARLAKKPEDDATDDDIDEVIKDYNDNGVMTIEEIAKTDDKIRLLEAKKADKVDDPEKKDDDPNEPAWFKAYREKTEATIKSLQDEKVKDNITSKFANDERIKGIPDIIRKGFMPTSDDDYEEKVTQLVEEYKPFAEKNKLADFGKDAPVSSDDTTKKGGEVKKLSTEEAKEVVKGM